MFGKRNIAGFTTKSKQRNEDAAFTTSLSRATIQFDFDKDTIDIWS